MSLCRTISAMSGKTSLWRTRPCRLEEIRRKARQFEKRIRHRNLREYVGAAVAIAAFTFYIFKFPSPMIRAGSALIIAGVICIVIQIYKRASPGTLPADAPLNTDFSTRTGQTLRAPGGRCAEICRCTVRTDTTSSAPAERP